LCTHPMAKRSTNRIMIMCEIFILGLLYFQWAGNLEPSGTINTFLELYIELEGSVPAICWATARGARIDGRRISPVDYFPNIDSGGHFTHNNNARIAISITRAIAVSRAENFRLGAPGQIPLKSATPRMEMMDDAIASCLHNSAPSKIPQKESDATTKPVVERSQKGLASSAADLGEREGSSHERTDSAVRLPDLTASTISAKNALPWATPWSNKDAMIRILMSSGDMLAYLHSSHVGAKRA
jgi:hypothetical protein